MEVVEKKKVLVPALRFNQFSGDWKVERFGNLLIKSRLGGNYENSEEVTQFPLIKMGNLGRGNIVVDKVMYIPSGSEISSDDEIKEGDLFFNTRNTLELVGKVAIWKNELPKAFYNSNLMYIKFEDNYFMNYRLNSFEGIKGLRRLATGTTSVAAIYTKDLLKLKLTIPTLPEQQKIAAFLSAVDEKIQQLRQKKALLEKYKKGVMQKLFPKKAGQAPELRFTQPNGSNYPDWQEKKLGEVASYFSGGTPSSKNKAYYSGIIPFIGSGNINDESVDSFITEEALNNSSAKLVEKGDLLYALYGATSGEVGVSKINGAINQAVLCIRTTEIKEFLFHWLSYSKELIIKTYLQGGQGNLSASIIKSISCSFPSKEEQQKIADFLSGIDQKINQVETQINQTQTFKKGLLQQMFV